MASVTALKVSVPKLNFGFGVKNNHAISVTMQEIQVDLRKSLLSLAILPLLLASTSSVAHADEAKDVQKYYWGVGCFWHAQHEFINAEKQVLGRSDDQLTVNVCVIPWAIRHLVSWNLQRSLIRCWFWILKSKAGYAGGSRLGKDSNRPGGKGLACYHNMMNIADYGQLGYGEVVGVDIPKGNVRAFADQYFSLFGKDSERPDKVTQPKICDINLYRTDESKIKFVIG